MSRTPIAHLSLTTLAVALALLAAGCAGTADGAETGGCRDNGGWSAPERAQWLRPAVSFDDAATGEDAAVRIRPRTSDHGEPLCRPVTVQVEFWRLTATGADAELSAAQRLRLGTDGTEDQRIGFPPGLSADRRGACTGVLMAAYVDDPLTDAELPGESGHLAAAGTKDVEFGTDRITAYRLVPPSAPETCGVDGDGEADAETTTAPPATSNPWGAYHP
ncbi:hypothetical protein [Streptomyces sp. HUAS ZL42]|uniref:hypothetical protein n=1 Tax=Streptomyces sp. HUAS ZL42 TaxID=3231715 RepID=UPI00345EDA44